MTMSWMGLMLNLYMSAMIAFKRKGVLKLGEWVEMLLQSFSWLPLMAVCLYTAGTKALESDG